LLIIFMLALVFFRWGGCFVEGEVCYSHDDCEDGSECTDNYCKDVYEFCEGENDTSGRCRYDLVPDGTPCIAPGKDEGVCRDGVCVPADLGLVDGYDAGILLTP
jgi:hypothetical protein